MTVLVIRLAPPSSVSVERGIGKCTQVDRLAEGHLGGRDILIARIGGDRSERGDRQSGRVDDIGDGSAGGIVIAVARERPRIGIGARGGMGGAAEVQQSAEVRRNRRLDADRRSGGSVRVTVISDLVRCDRDDRRGFVDRLAQHVRCATQQGVIPIEHTADRIGARTGGQHRRAETRHLLFADHAQQAAADLIGGVDRPGVEGHRTCRREQRPLPCP